MSLLSLASNTLVGGGGGFNFTDLLNNLDQWGFFEFLLPFLLIFALVYAILGQINIFKDNKGASIIVAIAIGFLSLQLGFVSTFFQTIFPRFGVALSILLVALILAGTFISSEKSYKWIFFGLGGLIFLFVLFSSMSSWRFYGAGNWNYWWDQYAGLFIFLLMLIGVIIAVTLSNKDKGGGAPVHS